MTQKINLVLDEEQALFVSIAILLSAAIASTNVDLTLEATNELFSMMKDGTVKMETVKGLVAHADTMCDVFDPDGRES